MGVKKLQMANTRPRLPEWFRVKLPSGELQEKFRETKDTVTDNMLHTVCQEARCPNIHECWAAKDATFMVAGQECTRGCRFCAVGTIKRPPPLDENEPKNLDDLQNLDNLKSENKPKNENNTKEKDDLKSENNLKNEDDFKNEDDLKK